jgi:catechol 2,3-dioxygenase-like lactoylglutathione lyase family enzyme
MTMQLVPELICTNLDKTVEFYVNTLEFSIKYERPEDRFAYLTRERLDVMFEELSAPGRHWLTGEMKYPFGRGLNLQWETSDVVELHERVLARSPSSIYLPLETASYRRHQQVLRQAQFIVQDRDGYLFRFCSS